MFSPKEKIHLVFIQSKNVGDLRDLLGKELFFLISYVISYKKTVFFYDFLQQIQTQIPLYLFG